MEFHYILTIQGYWGYQPTGQHTIKGTIGGHISITRKAILDHLMDQAAREWQQKHPESKNMGHTIVFFSLEKNDLGV